MRVLVVDDSAAMRTIIKRVLGALDVQEITEAGDGAEALVLFDQSEFDLILSDWVMPKMDGLEFLKEVRKRNPTVPFLMVTTEAERARVISAIQAGVSDYVVKPFTVEVLKSKLGKWVMVKAQERQ